MKLQLTFKDPDGVWDSIRRAAKDSTANVTGVSSAEIVRIRETRMEELFSACKLWVEDREYVTIEIDTDSKTATVLNPSGR